ncbi:MAG: hypothetical protein LBT20_04335 [Clostridiales bacterium]|jgi:hypothetical protein|nr:hypothetical protein [Clostridiales bacterium]
MLKKSNTVFFRKIMAVILVAAFSAIVLTSCNFLNLLIHGADLSNDTSEPKDTEFEWDGDRFVGLFLIVVASDGTEFPTTEITDEFLTKEFLTDNLDKSDMLGIWTYYVSRFEEDGRDTGYHLFESNGLVNVGFSFIDGGNSSGCATEADFVYTEELDGAIIFPIEVYQKKSGELYTFGRPGHTIHSKSPTTEFGVYPYTYIYYSEELTETRTFNGMVETRHLYTGSVLINICRADKLLSAKVYEYDNDMDLINTAELDKNIIKNYLSEPLYNNTWGKYQTQATCAYVVIEEKYQKSDGSIYLRRSLISKNDADKGHGFYFPIGNGFVDLTTLTFEF